MRRGEPGADAASALRGRREHGQRGHLLGRVPAAVPDRVRCTFPAGFCLRHPCHQGEQRGEAFDRKIRHRLQQSAQKSHRYLPQGAHLGVLGKKLPAQLPLRRFCRSGAGLYGRGRHWHLRAGKILPVHLGRCGWPHHHPAQCGGQRHCRRQRHHLCRQGRLQSGAVAGCERAGDCRAVPERGHCGQHGGKPWLRHCDERQDRRYPCYGFQAGL